MCTHAYDARSREFLCSPVDRDFAGDVEIFLSGCSPDLAVSKKVEKRTLRKI